jgi:hypothetical protein
MVHSRAARPPMQCARQLPAAGPTGVSLGATTSCDKVHASPAPSPSMVHGLLAVLYEYGKDL